MTQQLVANDMQAAVAGLKLDGFDLANARVAGNSGAGLVVLDSAGKLIAAAAGLAGQTLLSQGPTLPPTWDFLRAQLTSEVAINDPLLFSFPGTYADGNPTPATDPKGRGILFWLGQNKGAEAWSNPYERDLIDITGAARWVDGSGPAYPSTDATRAALVDRLAPSSVSNQSAAYLLDSADPEKKYLNFDFKTPAYVRLTGMVARLGRQSQSPMAVWQGSVDGLSWFDISAPIDVGSGSVINVLSVSTNTFTGFRFVRLAATAADFFVYEVEFYGFVNEPPATYTVTTTDDGKIKRLSLETSGVAIPLDTGNFRVGHLTYLAAHPDATAPVTVTSAAGAVINFSHSDKIHPGKTVQISYDGANEWRLINDEANILPAVALAAPNDGDTLRWSAADGRFITAPQASGGDVAWTTVSAARPLESGARYALDVSGGAFDLTMPAAAANGDWIEFAPHDGDLRAANVTLLANGASMPGAANGPPVAQNFVIENNTPFRLVYRAGGSTPGWRIG